MALKLIGLCQNKIEPSLANLGVKCRVAIIISEAFQLPEETL